MMTYPAAIAASVLIALSASVRAKETGCLPLYFRLPDMEPAKTEEELHWREHPSVAEFVAELAAPIAARVAHEVLNCARTEGQQTEPCSIRWFTDWFDETQEHGEIEEQMPWSELTDEQERLLIDFAKKWAATKRNSDSTASTHDAPPGSWCSREEAGSDVPETTWWKGDTNPCCVQPR